ncbi:MAG: 2-C-methyl-D-erythritol 4-phosphate cytidylyltransferase [Planctomycetota bacterium]
MATFSVILAAAGKSSRFRDKHYKKPFAPLADRAVWLHSAERFLNRDDVKQLIVVISPEDREVFQSKFAANVAILGIETAEGGRRRGDSIANALRLVRDDVDMVAVHDAARPCVASQWIDTVFSTAEKSGAAILAIPVTGTLKRSVDGKSIDGTVTRANLWEAQTPQAFRRSLLVQAYAQRGDLDATDDAELVERLGQPVTIVPGSPINMKITTREDLRLAAQAMKALPKPKLWGPSHPFADDDLWR